jgi:colanic acid/amylovoran biosynthesis protein
MRVVITNCQLYNGGDAAIAVAIMGLIARAFGRSTEITILDPSAEGTRKYYPDLHIGQMPYHKFGKRRRFIVDLLGFSVTTLLARLPLFSTITERSTISIYDRADLVISTGGTYLVEQYDLTPRIYELFLALAARRPLVFFAQSLGPFVKEGNRRALRKVFGASPLIMVRDARSRRHLLELGIDSAKIHVVADAAFSLVDPDVIRDAKFKEIETPRVAVSVRHWDHFRAQSPVSGMNTYKRSVARAVEWLVAVKQAEVVFISTCQGIPEYWAQDSVIAQEIVAILSREARSSVTVDHEFRSPQQLIDKLRTFDFAVATRMHMAILSLAAGLPVLPIAYEFKTEELFRDKLEMGRWLLSIDDLKEESIEKLLPDFLAELPIFRSTLFDAVLRERESALEASELLKSLKIGRNY